MVNYDDEYDDIMISGMDIGALTAISGSRRIGLTTSDVIGSYDAYAEDYEIPVSGSYDGQLDDYLNPMSRGMMSTGIDSSGLYGNTRGPRERYFEDEEDDPFMQYFDDDPDRIGREALGPEFAEAMEESRMRDRLGRRRGYDDEVMQHEYFDEERERALVEEEEYAYADPEYDPMDAFYSEPQRYPTRRLDPSIITSGIQRPGPSGRGMPAQPRGLAGSPMNSPGANAFLMSHDEGRARPRRRRRLPPLAPYLPGPESLDTERERGGLSRGDWGMGRF